METWSGTAFLKAMEAIAVTRMLGEAGFDGVAISDHLIYPREPSSPYPQLRVDGRI
jgi:hypothetical protein